MSLIQIENLFKVEKSKSEPITLEELIDALMQQNKSEITTKELKELGFNNNQITQIEEQGTIQRVVKGLYQVPKIIEKKNIEETENQNKISHTYFHLFKCSVLEGNFKEAYQNLCNAINTRLSHDYDDHYYLYLRLLKEILGDKEYDFDMLENGEIQVVTDSYEIGSIMETFSKFKFSVLNGDFEQANNYINEFDIKRKKRGNGVSQVSTQLFLCLTNEVCQNQKNAKRKDQQKHFDQFYIKIREENFIEAYQELCKAEHSSIRNSYYGLYFVLLKEILKNEHYDFSLVEQEIEPNPDIDYNNETLNKFRDAVLNKDYTHAKAYIKELMKMEGRTTRATIYYYLIGQVAKRQNNHTEETEDPIVISAFELPKEQEEQVESESMFLSRSNIQTLISDKKYSQAKTLIENNLPVTNRRDSIYFQNVLRLLNILETLETEIFRFKKPLPNSCYQNIERDIFSYFFEALKKEDLETAYHYAVQCDKKEKEKFGKAMDFETYVQLLESILVYKNIKEYTHEKELTKESLKALKELYQEKIGFSTKSKQYDMYVLDVLNTLEGLESSSSNPIFCEVNSDKANIVGKFEDVMNFGGYDKAIDIMNSCEWRDETRFFPYKDQVILINKILLIINGKRKNSTQNGRIEKELEPSPIILEQLQQLKDFIEKDDFDGCQQYLSENIIEEDPKFLEEFKNLLDCFLKVKAVSTTLLEENSEEPSQYKLGSIQ